MEEDLTSCVHVSVDIVSLDHAGVDLTLLVVFSGALKPGSVVPFYCCTFSGMSTYCIVTCSSNMDHMKDHSLLNSRSH